MNTRMIKAEILKLTKRRSLMAWALFLTSGAVTVMFTVLAVRHASDPQHYRPAGGVGNFKNAAFFLANMATAAAVLIGSMAGAGDHGAGVFRDLAATGRSRIALFGVRAVGGLIVLVPIVALGVTVAGLAASMLAGAAAGAAPSVTLVLEAGGWILLTSCTMLLVAVGLSALLGSRTQTVTALLAFELLVSNLLLQVSFLGHVRDAIPLAAMQHFAPTGVLRSHAYATSSAAIAAFVLVGWIAAALIAGTWRTRTRAA